MALAKSIAESPRKFLPFKSVLIVTDSADQNTELNHKLQALGYNTIISVFSGGSLKGIPRQTPDAVIVRLGEYSARSNIIAEALLNRYSAKNIPIIGILPEQLDLAKSAFDTVLIEPVYPMQIAHRVRSMVRLSIMQTEIALRLDTLYEDFGITHRLEENAFHEKLKVLFIGKATPEFMVIINALERKNVEVIAAFTSFTAFDFLHEFTFDAVVMNALKGMEPGLTISQTMRRNSSLYHTPALLLGHKGQLDSDKAYEHGVSDILFSDTDEKDIQNRILELARFHRLHRQVKAEFDNLGHEEVVDSSGTYSGRFFSKHLNRLVNTYSTLDLPVSVLTIDVRTDSDDIPIDQQDKALNEFGSMIKNLVRVYDVTARISRNVFVIAFPGQPASTLAPVIERINTITASTKFLPDTAHGIPQTIHLNIDTAELSHGVTGDSWLAQRLSA